MRVLRRNTKTFKLLKVAGLFPKPKNNQGKIDWCRDTMTGSGGEEMGTINKYIIIYIENKNESKEIKGATHQTQSLTGKDETGRLSSGGSGERMGAEQT